jgi:hypothetical protein
MITRFGDQAVIELRPGVEDDRELPALIGVGTPTRAQPMVAPSFEAMGEVAVPSVDESVSAATVQTPHERAVRDAGWDSVEDYEDARRLLGFPRR